MIVRLGMLLAVSTSTGCAVAMTQQMSEKRTEIKALSDQCAQQMRDDHSLDPIGDKVELYRADPMAAPPFAIASNDTFPTESERPAIAQWAKDSDDCAARANAVLKPPSAANAAQRVVFEQDVSYTLNARARVQELRIALYQQKLTYGEFAQERFKIVSAATQAERDYRQAVIDRDQQRQMQISQQFTNSLNAWSAYVQAVNSRLPQSVYVNGTVKVQ